MGTKDFTKKLAEKSGIDGEKEELLGVENMIKVVDLKREVRALKGELKEKDKEIERLKSQLNDK
jgi:predicted RNase H-like nuclease (RuvC/YqgF family)